MTPARFRWGVLLVTIGLLLLFRNMGLFNDDIWIALAVYSPLVLIAIGIEKICTRTRVQVISYLTSGFLLIGGLAIAFYAGSGQEGGFFTETSHTIRFDPKVRSLSAELNLNETDLTIRDSGDDLVYGEFARFTRKPKISYLTKKGVAEISFDSRRMSYLGGVIKIDTDDDRDWWVQFHENTPLDLSLSGHDNDIHLNMSTTPLRLLKLDTDDAVIYLKIGELEPMVRVIVGGEDSRFKLRVPQSVGLRVHGADYRSYLKRLGLAGDDDVFETEGYDTNSTRIEVDLDDRLSSFSIDYF